MTIKRLGPFVIIADNARTYSIFMYSELSSLQMDGPKTEITLKNGKEIDVKIPIDQVFEVLSAGVGVALSFTVGTPTEQKL